MNRIILLLTLLATFSSCLKRPDYHIDIYYTGEQLSYIQCPVGGFGTGNIVLNGYAGISDLKIFNDNSWFENYPNNVYFTLHATSVEGDSIVRIMEAERLNVSPVQSEIPTQQYGGLPRFNEAIFHNAYPFIRIDLIDEEVPLQVKMESWSPLIPGDQINSTLPCAIIEWKLTNTAKSTTEYSVSCTMMNPLYDSLLSYTRNYDVCLVQEGYYSSPNNDSNEGVLFICDSLEPGESVSIPFLFSWPKPSMKSDTQSETNYSNFEQLRAYVSGNIDYLRSKTLLFSEAMITSSVPQVVLDAGISNLPGLKARTSVFPGYEICLEDNDLKVQMINIVLIYLEWKMNGSNKWLGELWPDIRTVLEKVRNGDEKGSIYLNVLNAGTEMALAMNEPKKSLEYNEIYKVRFREYTDSLGRSTAMPKDQYDEAGMTDFIIGQYLSFISGMGYLLDTAEVQAALSSIYQNSFGDENQEIENFQRSFADDEMAYQLAASLIYAGMREEGLQVVSIVRQEFSGKNRNPFELIKNGEYSAWNRAAWSVYQAMAGYKYEGENETMIFAPAEDVLPIRFFWYTGTGWGTIEASRAKIELTCLHGELHIEELGLAGNSFFVFREFDVSDACEVIYEDRTLKVLFPKRLILTEGESFLMSLP